MPSSAKIRASVHSCAFLFHSRTTILVHLLISTFPERLLLRCNVHSNVQESFVQKGNPSFEAPCHCGLVGPQTVRRVEELHTFHCFLVEGFWRRRGMEVEIPCGWVRQT